MMNVVIDVLFVIPFQAQCISRYIRCDKYHSQCILRPFVSRSADLAGARSVTVVRTRLRQVSEVRKDVHMIRHEIDQLQSAKAEMEKLRECVERLEEEQRRRKARSVDQVSDLVTEVCQKLCVNVPYRRCYM